MELLIIIIGILALLGLADCLFFIVLFKCGFKEISQSDNILSESDLYQVSKKK